MIETKTPAFAELSELASSSAGGKLVFSTDDFFAPCENMISDEEPVWIAEKFTEYGKWMDGWETRRKRIRGHDWCIIKLATKCIVRGLLVDTAFFTGNYAPKYSIQAACLTPEDIRYYMTVENGVKKGRPMPSSGLMWAENDDHDEEEALIPERRSQMGTACSECNFEKINRFNSDKWDEIVPVTPLRPGYEDTRLNYQKVVSDDTWTHLRINIYPDGGIARLRVYGEAKPEVPAFNQLIDLVSLLNGGTCQGYSNAHYGHPKNMIKPGKSRIMSDGWETARRLDRPNVIEVNADGTLKVPGQEWAVFKLGFPGRISKICIDTAHFKGNFPDSVTIDGAFLPKDNWNLESEQTWHNILKPSKMTAHNEHWFDCNSDIITHIKVTMAPDGGISRIRTFGYVDRLTIL